MSKTKQGAFEYWGLMMNGQHVYIFWRTKSHIHLLFMSLHLFFCCPSVWHYIFSFPFSFVSFAVCVFIHQDGVGGLLSLFLELVHLLWEPQLSWWWPQLPVAMHDLRRQLGGWEICGWKRQWKWADIIILPLTASIRCLLCLFLFLCIQAQKNTKLSLKSLYQYLSSPVGTFATNPQYRIQVTVIDEKEQGDVNILLSLMQKPQQENRKEIRTFPMALTLFKVCILNFGWMTKQCKISCEQNKQHTKLIRFNKNNVMCGINDEDSDQ